MSIDGGYVTAREPVPATAAEAARRMIRDREDDRARRLAGLVARARSGQQPPAQSAERDTALLDARAIGQVHAGVTLEEQEAYSEFLRDQAVERRKLEREQLAAERAEARERREQEAEREKALVAWYREQQDKAARRKR
jgi:hypothetical protein